jgi:hypothetical protein
VSKALRVRHRLLQTPVVRFEDPKSGRNVTVVATMHMGTVAYYEQLRAVISELESAGAVVCLEGTASASEQELAAASGEERAALGRYETWRGPASDLSRAAGRALGWVDQSAALSSSPSWRNADMTKLEMVRRAGAQNLQSLHVPGDEFTRLTPDQQDAFAAGGYAILTRLEQLGWLMDFLPRVLARLIGGGTWRLQDVQIEGRNSHVLARLPAESDAVLPWGAGHLRGLATGLRNAGYRRRDTTWVTVGRLPAVWPSVRLFWTGFRALWTALGADDDDSRPPAPDSDGDAQLPVPRPG